MQEKCQARYTIPDARKANTPIDVQKQKEILAEGEYCPPLSTDALKKHDLETSCELRQFRCPKCYVYWWKTVPKYKPVSTCFECQVCLNPLEYNEQFGVGRFACQCGNFFFSKQCQGSDTRVCIKCGRTLHRPYIHPLFRMDDFQRIPITVKRRHPTGKASAAPRGGYCYLPTGYVPRARAWDKFTCGDAPVYFNLPQPRRRPHRSQFGDFISSTFYYGGLHQPTTSHATAHFNTTQALEYPAGRSVEGINSSIATNNAYPPEAVVSDPWNHSGPSHQPSIPPLSDSVGGLESVGATLHDTTSSQSDHVNSSQTNKPQHLPNPQVSLYPPLPPSIDSPLVCTSSGTRDQPPPSLSEPSLPSIYNPSLTTAISSLAIDPCSLAVNNTTSIRSTCAPQPTQLASSSNCVHSSTNTNLSIAQDEANSLPPTSTASLSSAEPLSVATTPPVHVPERITLYDPSLTTPISSSAVDSLAISKPSLIQLPLESRVLSVDKPVDFDHTSEITATSSSTSKLIAESSIDLSPQDSPSQPPSATNDSSQPLVPDLISSQAELLNSSSVTTDNSAGFSAFQTETNISVNLKASQEIASRSLNSSQNSEVKVSASINLDASSQVSSVATTSPQSETTSSAPQQGNTMQSATQLSVNLNVSLNTSLSLTDSTTLNSPTTATDTGHASTHKARFFRDPRKLKYKQVSTIHDCSGSTESTIVPQLDDWPQVSKLKQHHHAYRRPLAQMPTYDSDDTTSGANSSSSSDLEDDNNC